MLGHYTITPRQKMFRNTFYESGFTILKDVVQNNQLLQLHSDTIHYLTFQQLTNNNATFHTTKNQFSNIFTCTNFSGIFHIIIKDNNLFTPSKITNMPYIENRSKHYSSLDHSFA